MKNRNILKKIYLKIKKIILKILNLLRKFKKKIKNTKNLYYTIKSIILSSIVSMLLLLAIYLILPKTSWLNISAKPDSFEIYDFYGNGLVNTAHIELDKGILINKHEVVMMIDDRRYDLKENELQFVIDNVDLYAEKEFDDGLSAYLAFNKNVSIKFGGYIYDINPINRVNIKIKRDRNSLSSVYENYYFYISSDNNIEKLITVYNDTEVYYSKKLVDIYIKGNKIEVPELSKLRFFSKNENNVATSFSFLNNSIFLFSLNLDDNCYFRGEFTSFNGNSLPTSTLKQTYLNKQNEYDISLLRIDSIGNDQFQLEYKFADGKNNLQISGKAKEINMSDNSLNYSIYTFLSENQGEIIVGIFAAFIAAYIPMILTHKKE